MKLFCALAIFLLFTNCSFDNKSGIWDSEDSKSTNKENIVFKDFKKLSSSTQIFNETIPIDKNVNIKVEKPVQNQSWTDIYFNEKNNIGNLKFNNLNKIILKSKRLSRSKINNYKLLKNEQLFMTDDKGNIYIYSLEKNTLVNKFNFYKKNYRHLKKELNLIIEKEVLYVSDNIGYIYAFNYVTNKLIWAKSYNIPFRSNIKLFSNNIVTSNQNNDLFIFDKISGNLIKSLPSEETKINNLFINNLVLSESEIFFINTFGSLYSISIGDYRLNWFVNLNKSTDLTLSELYNGSELVYYNNKILTSSNENFYILDGKSGFIANKKNLSLLLRPIVNNNKIFVITKNNLLIAMELKNGKIIYSYNLNDKVASFIDSDSKFLDIKNMMLVNNEIYIFLKNSHLIKLNINGNINEIIKLPSSLKTYPIFANGYLIYLNKKNQIIVLN